MDVIVDPDRVRNYRYRCDDRSIVSPYLRKFICVRVAGLLPLRWSPNLVSMLANGCSMATFFMLVRAFTPRNGPDPSRLISVLAAFGIATYLILDNSDGIHARRLGLSSPLGDFIDHWLDAFSSFMIPLGILWMLQVGAATMFTVVALSVLAFWVANWEMRETGVLTLPRIGEVEGNILAICVHGLTAIFGRALFRHQIAGVAISGWLVLIVCTGFVSAIVQPLLARPQGRSVLFGVLASLAVYGVWYTLSYALPDGRPDGIRPTLIVGLVGVKHIGDLQRAHLLGIEYRAFDHPMLLVGLLLVASALADPLIKLNLFALGTTMALGFLTLKLAYQFYHAWRFVSARMDTSLLLVSNERGSRVHQRSRMTGGPRP